MPVPRCRPTPANRRGYNGGVETGAANIERALAYLRAIEAGETDGLAAYFDPEVEQTEFPNRMTAAIARNGLPAIIAGSKRGQQVMRRQQYEVRNAIASGETVVVEVTWTGELAIAAGSLPEGATLRAYVAIVLEFRDGLIVAQRNYDCYEPFWGRRARCVT